MERFFIILALTLFISFIPHHAGPQQAIPHQAGPHQAGPKQATAGGDESSTDLITKTCEHAVYKNLCVSSLQSSVGNKRTTVHDLATASLKIAMAKATETAEYINTILNSTADVFEQECLIDCQDGYIDAIDQLEDALAALDSKGFSDLTKWVQAAMSDSETCEEGFKEKPGHKSLLTDRNKLFNELCSNALAITNLLAGGAGGM